MARGLNKRKQRQSHWQLQSCLDYHILEETLEASLSAYTERVISIVPAEGEERHMAKRDGELEPSTSKHLQLSVFEVSQTF